ncbi:MAG: toll/interleukin-1 receptor domain-containing protein [Spirochaetes bacterium]|nr:toll/interleukin-1 receptor domain-containing protein [Spirochaetota bacterium]
MTKSQRINILLELFKLLNEVEIDRIYFIFKQFGIEYKTSTIRYRLSKEEYIKFRLEEKDDSVLLELYDHLKNNKKYKIIDLNIWNKDNFKLFISHITRYKKFARKLQDELKEFYITSFVAHNDIEPTKKWKKCIEHALITCDSIAALLMRGFNKSKWTDQEIGYCLFQKKLVIPLIYDLDPYGFFNKYQGINIKGKRKVEIAEKIFKILLSDDITGSKLTEILIVNMLKTNNIIELEKILKLYKKSKFINLDSLLEIEEKIESLTFENETMEKSLLRIINNLKSKLE